MRVLLAGTRRAVAQTRSGPRHRNRLLLVPKVMTRLLLEVMNSNYFADNKIGTLVLRSLPSIDFDVPTALKLSSGGTLSALSAGVTWAIMFLRAVVPVTMQEAQQSPIVIVQ